jgi:hypothetical protein
MARFVLFTYPDPDYAARWDSLSREDRQAEIDRHTAWFGKHGSHIQGGEELAWPQAIRTVRVRANQPVVTDGPFVEAKELLGGFIVIDAADMDEAIGIAGEWPALLQGPGAAVEVVEAGHTSA